MGCPTIAVLGQNLTFSIQAYDGTGAPASPAGDVSYGIYEDTTTTEILTGTMTKDFDSKTGLCIKQIACTAANGFEANKSYTVYITCTVSGVSLAMNYNFICLNIVSDLTFVKNVLEGDAEIDTTATPWQIVIKIKGTETELIRKDLKDINGTNLGSVSTVIGSAVESA